MPTRLAFDIEGDDLYPKVTKVHSIVIEDLDTGQVFSCTDNDERFYSIEFGVVLLNKADELYAHNGLGYDYPTLVKLCGFKPSGVCYDTQILCELLHGNLKDLDHRRGDWFPKDMIGKQSLEAWGHRLRVRKAKFGSGEESWAEWSPEMQRYCEQDVRVQVAICKYLEKLFKSQQSVDLEHDFAEIIRRQEWRGFGFNVEAAAELAEELHRTTEEIVAELREVFPPKVIRKELKTPAYWEDSDGTRYLTKKQAPSRRRPHLVRGPNRIKVTHKPFDPASRKQIAERLLALGWEPKAFTDKGNPTVDEGTLELLEFPEAVPLRRYFKASKILGALSTGNKAWLRLEKNGRIHGRVITNGAVTGRCTHSNPNLAQIPSVKIHKEDGKEVAAWGEAGGWGANCRALFGPNRPGFCLVGGDAAGLELRCLAHYLGRHDGGEYARIVCEGDVHTTNQLAFGLPPGKEFRPFAKTGIYAHNYGAGNEKLGSSLERLEDEHEQAAMRLAIPRWAMTSMAKKGPVTAKRKADWKRGEYARQRVLEGINGFGALVEGVKATAKARGYLVGLDGRRLHVRSEHAALNTLLQSAGALIVKQATVIWNNEIMPAKGLVEDRDYGMVAHVHDEWQTESREECAKEVGEGIVDSIVQSGVRFNLRCPLAAEYKIGANWAETH